MATPKKQEIIGVQIFKAASGVILMFGRNLYYIPDFYYHKAKLVIEADGPIHLLKKDYDKNRDEILTELGLSILRFENDQILTDMQSVLTKIKEYL
jgi:very-short-patch-repair endonuclease